MSACHDAACAAPAAEGRAEALIALAGNPNCGKTTLFNLLTGARQHVANWPGVTVERREGRIAVEGRPVAVVDLPGVYSLLGGGGADQGVARDFLLASRVDLVVNVVDASNLERHLVLTHELIQTGCPMIVALNMVDEARAAGLDPDVAALAERLGVPVIPMVARRGVGRRELLDAAAGALRLPPHPGGAGFGSDLEHALETVGSALGLADARRRRIEALRLLELQAAPSDDAAATALAEAGRAVRQTLGEDPADLLAATRYAWAHDTAAAGLRPVAATHTARRVGAAIDRVVLHEWLGVPIFLAVLYLVFVVSYSGGQVFTDLFQGAAQALAVSGLGHLLLACGLPDWAVAALAGGGGGGVAMVLGFVPPIGLTFLFLALLDDSGYMARAAYAMDRLMRRFGLPGNALVPMVIGFGCNVPAIMGSRIIEDPRGRLLTVLMQPFMSCSARLTIYMAFAVALFRSNGGQVVFLLYLLGIVVALFTAWLLGRTALRGEPMPFVMELPPYRLPSPRSVLLQSWQRLKVFLLRVGRVITVIALVLFMLPGIGWRDGALHATDIDHSLLAQGSRALVPLFEPMGLDQSNWPAVSGLIAGAAAKEIVIGTLNGIYQRQDGGDQMQRYREAAIGPELAAAIGTVPANARAAANGLLDPLGLHALGSTDQATQASGATGVTLAALGRSFTPLSAFAYLVFVLLYVPCASTMGALRREAGNRWTLFSIAYGSGLAWAVATVIFQAGSFAEHPQTSAAWIGGCVAAFAALVIGLRRHGAGLARRAGTALAPGAAS